MKNNADLGNNQSVRDLDPRKNPQTDQSKETVKLILDTTAELLEEVSVNDFNTNLLAKRAGIGVRTIYRYFPNKLAVITALGQRWADKELEWLNNFNDLFDMNLDWREAITRIFDGYASGASQEIGASGLRRAVKAVPELREIESQTNKDAAERVRNGLKKHGLALPEKREIALGCAFIEAAAAVYDFAWSEGKEYADELIEENKLIWINHLATYLD